MVDPKKSKKNDFIDPDSAEYKVGFIIGSVFLTYTLVRVVIKGVRVILKYLA